MLLKVSYIPEYYYLNYLQGCQISVLAIRVFKGFSVKYMHISEAIL